MWSVTNYFLLNLTLADILMATLNCIFSFIYMRDRCICNSSIVFYNCHRVWYFGSFYCSLNQFISLSTVPASVFTMLAITLDRRRAVMSPLSPRITKKIEMVSLLSIWTLCTIIALPVTTNSSTLILNPNAR